MSKPAFSRTHLKQPLLGWWHNKDTWLHDAVQWNQLAQPSATYVLGVPFARRFGGLSFAVECEFVAFLSHQSLAAYYCCDCSWPTGREVLESALLVLPIALAGQ